MRSEQSKYETIQRQRSAAINRYKRAYHEFLELQSGLQSAKNWYTETKDTVTSMKSNVDTFVNNRRSEGNSLLNQIESDRAANKGKQAELEQERLRGLMERMSVEGPKSPQQQPPSARQTPAPLFQSGQGPRYGQSSYQQGQYQMPTSPPAHQQSYGGYSSPPPGGNMYQQPYNPSTYGPTPGPTSPPPNQTSFGLSAMRNPTSPPPNQTSFGQSFQSYNTYGSQQHQHQHQPQQHQQPQHHQMQQQPAQVPAGFVPPPPPPGPPPLGPQQTIHYGGQPGDYSGQNQGAHQRTQSQQGHDPWAGLNAWK